MNTLKSFSLSLGLAALLASPLVAAADKYSFDGAHSSVGFAVKHLGIFNVPGTFDKFEGEIKFDEKNVAKSSVNVNIDATSVNTRQQMRDKDLNSPNFFDTAKYPKATFKSTKVEKLADGKLKVTGKLTIRDITKEVVLDTTITGKASDDYGKERIGFIATTTINRMDFGIAWNHTHKSGALTVAENVDITIQAEGIKVK